MTTENQNPIIIYKKADKSASSPRLSIIQILLFVLLGVLAVNVSGCATMSLWEKKEQPERTKCVPGKPI